MRRRTPRPTYRLRLAVQRLPRHTREAMLRGIATNRIIVGAYVDPSSGGVCPMLAAHRNGGRTSVASFARAWDEYTNARRPRRATRREVRALRSLLEWSLAAESGAPAGSIAEAAAQIRAERERLRCVPPIPPKPAAAPQPVAARPPEPEAEISIRRTARRRPLAWMRPGGPDPRRDVLSAAEAQLDEAAERESAAHAAEHRPV